MLGMDPVIIQKKQYILFSIKSIGFDMVEMNYAFKMVNIVLTMMSFVFKMMLSVSVSVRT